MASYPGANQTAPLVAADGTWSLPGIPGATFGPGGVPAQLYQNQIDW